MLIDSEFEIYLLLVLVLVIVRFCVLYTVLVFLVFALCPCVPVGETVRGFPCDEEFLRTHRNDFNILSMMRNFFAFNDGQTSDQLCLFSSIEEEETKTKVE